jgi:hypothetical protein
MMSGGPLPHAAMLHSIHLLGAGVGPQVHQSPTQIATPTEEKS